MTFTPTDSSFPNKRQVLRVGFSTYIPLALAIGLRFASEPTANLSYLLLAVYALFGRAHAIRALALSWLFTMINPGIAPDASAASIGRYAVLIAAACGIFMQNAFTGSKLRLFGVTSWTLLLGTFLVLHSMAFSPMVDVSVLKALSWTLAMTSLLSAWTGLPQHGRRQMENDLFLFLVLVLLASLPLIGSPIGYLANKTGFQGILNQPQAFGVFAALLGAWSSARLLAENKPHWRLFAVTGTCIGLIFMSEARTAGLALILSIILSLTLLAIFSARSLSGIAPALSSRRIWIVFSIVMIAGLALTPRVVATLDYFITKSDRAQVGGFLEAYNNSRGILIYPMLENIKDNPLTGIGFGIASKAREMEISRDPIFGLPIGASIEKGVAPLMILEELGVFGLTIVALWLSMLFYRSARSWLPEFTIIITVLMLNMGEASLFSPGGMGLLSMIFLGWAASDTSKRRLNRGE